MRTHACPNGSARVGSARARKRRAPHTATRATTATMYALRRRALGAAREQIHARLARGASAANATAATTRDVAMATTQGGVRAKSRTDVSC